ncbi:hypothetical protein MKW92_014730 [Papaver armeniacum]|nr:hypothetical protein MKW92_014730 [Papaver armeniacum]
MHKLRKSLQLLMRCAETKNTYDARKTPSDVHFEEDKKSDAEMLPFANISENEDEGGNS